MRAPSALLCRLGSTTLPRRPVCGLLIAVGAALFLLAGCTGSSSPVISQQEVKVTPDILHEIELPIYPNAHALERGTAVRQRLQSKYGGSEALQVTLETTDDYDRVLAFYAGQLPASSRKFSFHMGGGGSAAFEFWAKDGQREVVLTASGGVTQIQLTNAKLVMPSPSPSATGSPQAR
jgi:hypothetical protein